VEWYQAVRRAEEIQCYVIRTLPVLAEFFAVLQGKGLPYNRQETLPFIYFHCQPEWGRQLSTHVGWNIVVGVVMVVVSGNRLSPITVWKYRLI
jgi:hypothetical protein